MDYFTQEQAANLLADVISKGLLKWAEIPAKFRNAPSKRAGEKYLNTGKLITTVNLPPEIALDLDGVSKVNVTLQVTGYIGAGQPATAEAKPFAPSGGQNLLERLTKQFRSKK